MRKGAKRKTNQKDNEDARAASSSQENHKSTEATKASSSVDKRKAEPTKPHAPAKRAKAAKPEPESEPEYFEDKRNLEDLWKEAFPVGTEWDKLDTVYQFNWNFTNLEDAFEEGGILHGNKVYLFGCTEPQLVPFKGENKVLLVPAVVAVISPFPPSDMIGISSVQMEGEQIIPMKQMKMDWVPYIPLENRGSQVDRLKSQIFILRCIQRRTALKHLKIDRTKKFEYCLPYIWQPFKEDNCEQSSVVPIMYPLEQKPIFCEFDWELDDLEEFTDELIKQDELPEDQKDSFKSFVKENVRKTKNSYKEAKEARKKALEEMSEEVKKAYDNMRFYKFYPVQTPDTPDISGVKSPFINRYYGKAHKVL